MNFLDSDELHALEGAVTGVRLVVHAEGRWVPLRLDQEMEHKLGGMVASGIVLRPAHDLCSEAKLTLEVPRRGDMSRIYIRHQRSGNASMRDEPSYREAPYLILVKGVLCVRHLPAHAIVPSLATARGDGAWERFQLVPSPARKLPGEGSLAAFTLHGGSPKHPICLDAVSHRLVRSSQPDASSATRFALAWRPRTTKPSAKAAGKVASLHLWILPSLYRFALACLKYALRLVLAPTGLLIRSPGRGKATGAAASGGCGGCGGSGSSNGISAEGNGGGGGVDASSLSVTVYSPPGGGPPPFEFVESVVTDEATGEHLSHARVVAGSTRLEVLRFRVRGPLEGLTRTTTTAKSFGFAGFREVASETLVMGAYDGGPAEGEGRIHEFNMPPALIPNTVFAMGRYKVKIAYAAAGGLPTLRREEVDFSVCASA